MAAQDRLSPDAMNPVSIGLADLATSLDLGPSEHIALVGGGGKTTILHALGRQLKGSVILTTTTRMGSHQHGGFKVVSPDEDPATQAKHEPVLVWNQTESEPDGESSGKSGSQGPGPKVSGVSPEACDRFAEQVDHVVVEADGSRRMPFKAPAPFEPVVPTSVSKLISVIGSDALGRVISDQCHRPLRVAALAKCHPYQRLDPAHAASVLLHPNGPRRACPDGAEYIVIVTKVDDSSRPLAEELAHELTRREADLHVVLINTGHDAVLSNTVFSNTVHG